MLGQLLTIIHKTMKEKIVGMYNKYGMAVGVSLATVGALCANVASASAQTIDTLVNTATSTFETTTGFSMVSALNWGIDNLLKVFLGAGLAVLYLLRYWIVAIAVISILVYWGFHGFRFWKH